MKSCLCVVALSLIILSSSVALAEEPAKLAEKRESYAFLFGESIVKPGDAEGFGIRPTGIQWWVGTTDGKKPKTLDDRRAGRLRVCPIDQTVVLRRDDASLTLLGPTGDDLTLSLKKGPLAKAKLNDPTMLITTFSFTPDGKQVVFVNEAGAICRFTIGDEELVVHKNTQVDPSEGIHFSADGSRMLYEKYFRENDFVQPVFRVYIAGADGSEEKQLLEYVDGTLLGCGFLPDGRVGVCGPKGVTAIDPESGKSTPVSDAWRKPIEYRSFGGFHPDGKSLIFDDGGPYVLALFSLDVKSGKRTTVRDQYFESFQSMVWVRLREGDVRGKEPAIKLEK